MIDITFTLKFPRATSTFFDGKEYAAKVTVGSWNFVWDTTVTDDNINVYTYMNVNAELNLPILTSPSQESISAAGLIQMVVIKSKSKYEAYKCAEEDRVFADCLMDLSDCLNNSEHERKDEFTCNYEAPNSPTLTVRPGIKTAR